MILTFDTQIQHQQFIKQYTKLGYEIIDLYEKLTIEKYLIDNPNIYYSLDKDSLAHIYFEKHLSSNPVWKMGYWVVLEKIKQIYHLTSWEELLHLRTARNRNLINQAEQDKIYNSRIALAGLSVGSNVALALTRMGVGKQFKLADMDSVDPHNINRANYYLKDIGKPKSELIEKQMLSVDPYLKIEHWDKGLQSNNIKQFINDVDIVIDCFDNFPIKLELRKQAKKMKKPVISGFDIAKGCMLIVERYDKESKLNLDYYLNGFKETEILKPATNTKDKTNLFINIIGREYHSPQMLESVLSVGTKLTGYPQLIIATLLFSATVALVVTDIILGKSNKSMRKYINLDSLIYE